MTVQDDLINEINTELPTNAHNEITAARLRGVLIDMVNASVPFTTGQIIVDVTDPATNVNDPTFNGAYPLPQPTRPAINATVTHTAASPNAGDTFITGVSGYIVREPSVPINGISVGMASGAFNQANTWNIIAHFNCLSTASGLTDEAGAGVDTVLRGYCSPTNWLCGANITSEMQGGSPDLGFGVYGIPGVPWKRAIFVHGAENYGVQVGGGEAHDLAGYTPIPTYPYSFWRTTNKFMWKITGVSNANPAVITCVGHPFNTNDSVTIEGVNPETNFNVNSPAYIPWTITFVDADHFSIPVDTSTGATYINGGYAWDTSLITGITKWFSVNDDGSIHTVDSLYVGAQKKVDFGAGAISINHTTSPLNFLSVESNTASTLFKVDGSTSGSAAGAFAGVYNSGTIIVGMGNRSALVGGAYDSTPSIMFNGSLSIVNGGGVQKLNINSTDISTTDTVSITPTASSLSQGLNITQSVSGSTATYTSLNQILVTGDNAQATTLSGGIVMLNMPYLVTGGDQGFRQGVSTELRRTGASNVANVQYQDVGFSSSFNGQSNNNGTGGTPKGAGYGGYFVASLSNSATNWFVLSGFEIDIGADSTSSSDYIIGFRIAHLPTHATKGISYDTAMDFVDATGATAGWDALITASNVGGQYPLAATGTFIRTLGSQSFATGIDFSSATLSDSFLKGPSSNFVVAGTGVTTHTQALAANTSGDGLILINTTAATSGNQRYSPRLRLTGQGWKTDATAASQTVDWCIENRPVQGAATPTNELIFAGQINGGGYSDRGFFNDDGTTCLFGVQGSGAAQVMLLGGGNQLAQMFANAVLASVGSIANIPLLIATNSVEIARFNTGGEFGIGKTASTLLDVNGPVATKSSSTKTNDYTLVASDSALIFNGSGSITLTLQSAASYPGRWLYVKTIANQAVNSATAVVVPISTATAGTVIVTNTAGKWAALQSDGTNWVTMAVN